MFGDPDGQQLGVRVDLELATSSDIGFPQNLLADRSDAVRMLRACHKVANRVLLNRRQDGSPEERGH